MDCARRLIFIFDFFAAAIFKITYADAAFVTCFTTATGTCHRAFR